MFTDRINVRTGNARRRKALQRAAAKAAAVANIGNRAGGGLGRARGYQSRLGFLAPGLLRLGQTNPAFNIDDPFLQAERQPGAYDPGAQDAGMGGAGMPPQPPMINGYPVQENPNAPGTTGIGVQYDTNDPNPPATTDIIDPASLPSGPQGAPPGYVWYQGQLIPTGVYRAIQQGF